MSWPVTVLADGGMPVSESASGTPMTPMADGGMPVTIIEDGGMPVTFVDNDFQPLPQGYVGANIILPDSVHPDLAVVRAGATATRIDSSGALQVVAADTLRRDYSGVIDGRLIEQSAVNLVLRSNEFSNAAWTKNNSTVAAGVDDGEGGTSAFSVTATASTGLIQIAPAVTSGVDYVSSIYIKRLIGTGTISLRCGDTTLIPVTVTSEWTRVQASAIPSTTTGRFAVVLATSGDAVAVKYAQLELGTKATSHIQNVASANTRAADNVSLLLSALPQWNPLAGTFLIDFVAGPDVLSGKMLIDLNGSGGSNERLRVQTDATGKISLIVTSLGATQASMLSGAAIIPYTRNKVAISFKQDAFNLALNGVLATPDTSGLMPVLDRIQFGANYTKLASTFMNGHLRSVRYFAGELTTANLIALTS